MMVNRGVRATITETAMVTEFSMRMQNRRTTLGASIDKLRPTKYAVIVVLKDVREITAIRAKAIVVFPLSFACQNHLGEPMGIVVYDISFKNPIVKQAAEQGRAMPEEEKAGKKGRPCATLYLAFHTRAVMDKPSLELTTLLALPHRYT